MATEGLQLVVKGHSVRKLIWHLPNSIICFAFCIHMLPIHALEVFLYVSEGQSK